MPNLRYNFQMDSTERLVVWRYIWMSHEKTITIPNLTSFDTFCSIAPRYRVCEENDEDGIFLVFISNLLRWTLDSHQRVIRRSSDSHQRVIRWSSDGHQTVMRWLSDGHQMVIRRSLDGHQTVIRRSTDGYQTVIRGHHTIIRRSSDSFRKSLDCH